MQQNVFEIVTYTVKDPKLAQEVRDKLKPVLSSYPGFVNWRQYVSTGDDRRFVDHVEWADLSSAQAAQEKFMANEIAQALMAQTEEVHAISHFVETA